MSTAYKIKVVFVKEFGHNFGTKGEGHTAVILSPAHGLLVRVRPQQVAQQALVRDVCWPHDAANLFHGLQVRAQA